MSAQESMRIPSMKMNNRFMHIHGGCTCSKGSEEAQCPAAKYLHGEWDISEFFHAEERQEAV